MALTTRFALCLAASVAMFSSTGCSNDCSGDFCVEVLDSAYLTDRCSPVAGESCTFATVHFTAREKEAAITDQTELTVSLKVNDREVGAEGRSELTSEGDRLSVQLLLDRSFSITESAAVEGVRTAASNFISSLPDSAKIRISAFASEAAVPQPLWTDCATARGSFVDKAAAKQIVTDCYVPYPSATSSSQTKLYDAVANIPSGIRGYPNVLVVFTDGSDTASSEFKTAEAVRAQLDSRTPRLEVYAIGLGAEPNEAALNTISEQRFHRANDTSSLEEAFSAVSKELTAIHTFKVLVAGPESDAQGRLTVTHKGRTVEKTFELNAF